MRTGDAKDGTFCRDPMTEKKKPKDERGEDILKAKSPWTDNEDDNRRAMSVTLDSLAKAVAEMHPNERRDFERGARDYKHIGNLIDETTGHILAAAHFAPEAGLRGLLAKVLPAMFEIRVRLERMSRGMSPVPQEPPRIPYVEHDCLTREHDPEEWCPDCFAIDKNGKPKKNGRPWNQDAEVR